MIDNRFKKDRPIYNFTSWSLLLLMFAYSEIMLTRHIYSQMLNLYIGLYINKALYEGILQRT